MKLPFGDAGRAEGRALTLLLAVVSLAFVWILLPFAGAILWGVIIALLFTPLYRWLLPRLRRRRTAAALVTMAVVLVVVVLPFVFISAALAREAAALYQRVQSGEVNLTRFFHEAYDALPDSVDSVLGSFGLVDFDTLQRRLHTAVAEGSQFIATQALNLGQNTFDLVASLFITLYLAFFLIRDGDGVVRSVRRAIPLAPQHQQELLDKFGTVIRATVRGNLLVAALQGALGGLAFWFLGLRAALLWGVLMAFLSLLPAVGAALVWAPVAVYFVMTGALLEGIGLAVYGVLVIGLVDNLLRPLLVGQDTRMPDYLVMITTLGGMAVFGINGFVVGPAIAAMFIAVWQIEVGLRTGGRE